MKNTPTVLISGSATAGCKIVKRRPSKARLCESVDQFLMFLDFDQDGKFACVVNQDELKLVDLVYGVRG